MPKIEPFRGMLYNAKKVNIAKVVAPPYDIISPEMQNELYAADEHNIVRLILGKDEPGDSEANNKYIRAKKFFNKWIKEDALTQDEAPAIYVYEEEYSIAGRKKSQLGFIGLMKIEDSSRSSVRPHENTFAKPKQDRLNLIRQVRANLSCVFTLFDDKGGAVGDILGSTAKKKPLFNFIYDDVRHKLWRLDDKKLIGRIQKAMAKKEIFIADGHHRYEVAVEYSRESGCGYVMMYFTPISEKGLTILATHRLVRNIYMDPALFIEKLKAYFSVTPQASLKGLLKKMAAAKKNEYLFGVYLRNGGSYLLKLKKPGALSSIIKENRAGAWKKLDVSVLHGVIFNNILALKDKARDEDNIVYTRDPEFAVKEMKRGMFDAAFLLNPTRVGQVREIAAIGERMPHKSTYFYPKLVTGLVINKHARD
jgi:uncharacterized protein (DUF1015 family)